MDDIVEKLLACVLEEDGLITEFATLLGAETVALTERKSFDNLQAITEAKNEFAARLQALSDLRNGLLAELGLPDGHQGTGLAAEQYPQLAGPWKMLLDRSAAAATVNERNGALIDMHLRYTEEALVALRKLTSTNGLYDAYGRSRKPAGNLKSIVAG